MNKKVVFFRYIVKPFIRLIPLLKGNYIKRFVYNNLGYDIYPSVVISSNAELLGNIRIIIKNNTFIGHRAVITGGGNGDITIGSNCDISSYVRIVSGTHEIDMFNIRTAGRGIGKTIIIEDGVWIGCGAIILGGVRIGFKSIIGAGAVVTKDIPPYSIATGSPAKVIKRWDALTNNWDGQ